MTREPDDTARHIARECQPQWRYLIAPARTHKQQQAWQEMKEPMSRGDWILVAVLFVIGCVLGALIYGHVSHWIQPAPVVDVEHVGRVG